VVDNNEKMVSLITSHNSHSASSDFSNVGLLVEGDIYKDILFSENAIANFSKGKLHNDSVNLDNLQIDENLPYKVTFLTEEEIGKELVNSFENLTKGDSLMIAAFYLSKRNIIRSILKASNNGADVSIILDPNAHGFGYDKTGIPNRPVAHELLQKSEKKIKLRWYLTHGEQFHTKFNYIRYIDGTSKVILGNSNLTKKNLGGYNLEAEFIVEGESGTPLMIEINDYYKRIWNNLDGNIFTVEYDFFKDESFRNKIRYRFGEAVGTGVY